MDEAFRYDIDAAVGFAIGRVAARLRIGLRRAFLAAGHDVTPEQWLVLYRLLENQGLTQCGLGERTIKDKTTITRILDRLEAKGLLARRRDSRDRRSQRIFLTPDGEALAQRVVPLVRQFATTAYADLEPGDHDALRRVLGRIESGLDAIPEPKDQP